MRLARGRRCPPARPRAQFFAGASCPDRVEGMGKASAAVAGNFSAADLLHHTDLTAWSYGTNRGLTFSLQPRSGIGASDTQSPYAFRRVSRDADTPISEIQPKQIGVLPLRLGQARFRGAAHAAGRESRRRGCSRQSFNVTQETPVIWLIALRLRPSPIRARARSRVAWSYMLGVLHPPPTKRDSRK
jgi:hypothetical protein